MSENNKTDNDILDEWKQAFKNNPKSSSVKNKKSSNSKKRAIILLSVGAIFLMASVFAILLLSLGNGENGGSSQTSEDISQINNNGSQGGDEDYQNATSDAFIQQLPPLITSPDGIERSNQDFIYHSGNKISKDAEEIKIDGYFGHLGDYIGIFSDLRNLKVLDFNHDFSVYLFDSKVGTDTVEEIYFSNFRDETYDVREISQYKNLKHLDISFYNINQYEFNYLKKELPECEIIYNFISPDSLISFDEYDWGIVFGSKPVNSYLFDEKAEYLPIYNYMVDKNTKRLAIGLDYSISDEYLSRANSPFLDNLTELDKLEELSIESAEVIKQLLEYENLAKLKNLKSLSLNDIDKITDINNLNALENLEELKLNFRNKPLDLSQVNLPKLKTLIIETNVLTWDYIYYNTSILDLRGFPEVESLELVNFEVNDFNFLSPLKKIKSLSFDSFVINIKIDEYLLIDTLEEVNLFSNNGVGNVSFRPFSRLKNLKVFTTQYCETKDYELLYNSVGLESLQLNIKAGNTLLNFVSRMQNLKYLHISSGNINSLSPLEHLYQLEDLTLTSCNIKDISSLPTLPFLEKIDFSKNPITNIDRLGDFKDLKVLNLSSTRIADLTPISNNIKLEAINYINNEIKSLDFLKKMMNLKFLNISSASVNKSFLEQGKKVSLESISALPKLEEFYLSSNYEDLQLKAFDFSDLNDGFQSLKKLELEMIHDVDLNFISNAKSLESLSLSQCEFISDLTPISNLTNLRTLFISNCNDKDLKALSTLESLVDLRIFGEKLTSLKGVEGLKNLFYLQLGLKQLDDINEINRFKNSKLKYLDFSYNSFTNIDDLAEIPTLNKVVMHQNNFDTEYIETFKQGKFSFDLYYSKLASNSE